MTTIQTGDGPYYMKFVDGCAGKVEGATRTLDSGEQEFVFRVSTSKDGKRFAFFCDCATRREANQALVEWDQEQRRGS